MAFNMKRPTVKGTPLHKASIAKAKTESIVAQTRTQADGSLVGAGDALGKSYIPAAIDYSTKTKATDIRSRGGEEKKRKETDKDRNPSFDRKEQRKMNRENRRKARAYKKSQRKKNK